MVTARQPGEPRSDAAILATARAIDSGSNRDLLEHASAAQVLALARHVLATEQRGEPVAWAWAVAAPDHEPGDDVAIMWTEAGATKSAARMTGLGYPSKAVPLYAAPQPAQQPLTDEQKDEVLDALPKVDERETVCCGITGSTLRALATAAGIGAKS